MFTIVLSGYRCRAYHGVHPEERHMGQEFEVDISVCYPEQGPVTELSDTVNYADLLEIVKAVMAEPESLLETVAQKIAVRIKTLFTKVTEINISIFKCNAPISTFGGRVGVKLQTK